MKKYRDNPKTIIKLKSDEQKEGESESDKEKLEVKNEEQAVDMVGVGKDLQNNAKSLIKTSPQKNLKKVSVLKKT